MKISTELTRAAKRLAVLMEREPNESHCYFFNATDSNACTYFWILMDRQTFFEANAKATPRNEHRLTALLLAAEVAKGEGK